MMIHMRYLTLALIGAAVLAGCSTSEGTTNPAAGDTSQDSTAADYCTDSGGVVETRYPFYDTSSDNPLQLAGSLQVCTFTAGDESRITVSLDTLYSDQPTLAALAYRAQVPLSEGSPAVNPSSRYCTELGGTDLFGGTSAVVGGWGLEDAADVIALCIFPDLSTIDSWGLTYHSDDIIRGADLNDLLRYRPN
jgi:putative hemolysin